MAKGIQGLALDGDGLPDDMGKTAKELNRASARMLDRRGAGKDDPVLACLVHAANLCWLVLQRAAKALFAFWQTNACAESVETGKKARETELTEALNRAHEQWRRAMKDLRDYMEKVCTPAGGGALADAMKPLLKKAEGVLDDSLEAATSKESPQRESASEIS